MNEQQTHSSTKGWTVLTNLASERGGTTMSNSSPLWLLATQSVAKVGIATQYQKLLQLQAIEFPL